MMTYEAATLISGERREALLADARSNRLAQVSRRVRRRRSAGDSRSARMRLPHPFRSAPAPVAS
jgi:hypothetical protein